MVLRTLTLLFSLSFLLANIVFCQDQRKADSLKQLLNQKKNLSDSVVTYILYQITIASSSPDDKLRYSELLLEKSRSHKPVYYAIQSYNMKGVAYRQKGDLENSLKSLFRSAKLAAENDYPTSEAEAYIEIATSYSANSDLENSLLYQIKAIEIIRINGTREQLAISLLNTGFSYYALNQLDSALLFYNEAEPIFEQINLEIGKAYTIGNRALVYWKQGELQKAEMGLLTAIKMLQPLGDRFAMADYHNQLGNIYIEGNQTEKAIDHTKKAIDMAKEVGLKEQIRDANLLLSKLYAKKRNHQKAFEHQSQYIAYKDSIENTEQTKKIANMRTDFEVSLREKEIDLLEKREALNQTYIVIAIILLVLAIVMTLYFRQRLLNTKLISINERKQHNEKINDLLKTQETKALQSMVQGRENERKRLAQELHNHFGSLLATIKVNINGIDEKRIHNHSTLTTLVNRACEDIRNMSHALNMGISENFGLIPALKELTRHLRESNGLEVEFNASMSNEIIDSEEEIIIYRIIQELVSNVLKHAKATKLSILLTCYEDENLVNILVQDNGIGFNAKSVNRESGNGMGLNSLKKMVTDGKGDISFDSNPNSGTTVNIDLPVTNKTNLI